MEISGKIGNDSCGKCSKKVSFYFKGHYVDLGHLPIVCSDCEPDRHHYVQLKPTLTIIHIEDGKPVIKNPSH